MQRALVLACALAMCCARSDAQATVQGPRGSWFVHWGYNRAWYGPSDIHFSGDGLDITMHRVKAFDRPEPFSFATYFGPTTIWIPQYNYRAGYFLNDRWSVSLGLDHMKYVVAQGQRVTWEGKATKAMAGQWPKEEVEITPDLLQYEHTDGLNLLSVDLDHYHTLWASANGRQRLMLFEGLFVGPVIPRTDVRLFGEGINNKFHVAGWGAGSQAGAHFGLCKWMYLRTTVKGGYIGLPNVLTTGRRADRADQHFLFAQWNVVLGATFRTKPTRPVATGLP